MTCPCGNTIEFENCCQKIHTDPSCAQSAEMLMRARYSAFIKHEIDFIYNTFHPSTRHFQDKKDIQQWAISSKWMNLEILKSTDTIVEFKAHYLDQYLETQIHHERSTFKKDQGIWYYVDGIILP